MANKVIMTPNKGKVIATTFHMEEATLKIVLKHLKLLKSYAAKNALPVPKKKEVINFMLSKVKEIEPTEFFK